ncbi:hypothetical protein A2U01_0007458 [Trifolium medium]|uniref:Uncharacterized protein n=1 Tax=Trifolium medium TaxID=97028 RepID=A0A392MHT1_9FABA|nr:hypothetical protein [Trifolium medium]
MFFGSVMVCDVVVVLMFTVGGVFVIRFDGYGGCGYCVRFVIVMNPSLCSDDPPVLVTKYGQVPWDTVEAWLRF